MNIDGLNENEKKVYYVTKLDMLDTRQYEFGCAAVAAAVVLLGSMIYNYVTPNTDIGLISTIISGGLFTYCFGGLLHNIKQKDKIKEELEGLEGLENNGKAK